MGRFFGSLVLVIFTLGASTQELQAADELPQFKDCAVLERGKHIIIIGVGIFENYTSRSGSRTYSGFRNGSLSISGSGKQILASFKCIQHNTSPTTEAQTKVAVKAIDKKLEKVTSETQQAIATSFAVQLDIIGQELSEIRGILSSLPSEKTDVALKKLKLLEDRLETMQPAKE